jgi:hypothetical protein
MYFRQVCCSADRYGMSRGVRDSRKADFLTGIQQNVGNAVASNEVSHTRLRLTFHERTILLSGIQNAAKTWRSNCDL